jgi:hypothetical protein
VMLLSDSSPDRGMLQSFPLSTHPLSSPSYLPPSEGYGKIKRQPRPEVYGSPEEFLYYGSLEAIIASQQSRSLTLLDITGGPSAGASGLSESDLKAFHEYIDLSKQLLKQKTTIDIFYFVPSLNTIVENDLERWGYIDPSNQLAHPLLLTRETSRSSQSMTPPLPPPPLNSGSNTNTGSMAIHRPQFANSSPAVISSPQRPRPKLGLNTAIPVDPVGGKGTPVYPGGAYPLTSPRRPDILKCSTDNSAIFSELTRTTGGNLRLFFGSLHLEDNVNRLKSVSFHSSLSHFLSSPDPLIPFCFLSLSLSPILLVSKCSVPSNQCLGQRWS